MKGIFFLTIALLLLAIMLIRCQATIPLNEPFSVPTGTNAYQDWQIYLKSGDTISISLTVSNGSIDLEIYNDSGILQFAKTSIGTNGWQGQWTAPNNDTFDFVILLYEPAEHATGTINLTYSGGGSDATLIIVGVIFVVILLVVIFLTFRMRKKPFHRRKQPSPFPEIPLLPPPQPTTPN